MLSRRRSILMKLVEVEMTLETTTKVIGVIAEAAAPHVAEAAEAVAVAAAEMEAAVQVDHMVADQAVLSAFRQGSQLAFSRNG